MGSIPWTTASSWADTPTDSERLIPPSQEKRPNQWKICWRVTNQAPLQTAGSRENTDRGVERRRQNRESQQLLEEFFPLLFFLGFSPTQASHIFQQHVGLRRMIQKRNAGFAAHKQSHKYRFCGLEAEPGFKQKHSGEKKQHSKASFSALSTWLKNHTEKAKRDRERGREMMMRARLTQSRPGNTCRWRSQSNPQAKDEKRYKGERLWRRGGSVSLRGESGTHAGATFSLPSSHPLKTSLSFKEKKNPPRQQSRHKTETESEREGEREREWEGRSERERDREGDEECCNRVRECKRARERRSCDLCWTSHLSPLWGLECRLSASKESFPLDGNYMLGCIGNRSAFTSRPSIACKVQGKSRMTL